MKKLLLTALALGSFGFIACGGDKEESTEDTSQDTSQNTTAPQTKSVAFKIDGMT